MTAAIERRLLKGALEPFHDRSTLHAVTIFVVDLSIYLTAVVGAVWIDGVLLKLLCASVAGSMISALFVIGHDAAHGALTDSKRLNAFIGRVVFLPSLHNFSLWQIVHNRLHHSTPNVKGKNSWSPMSIEEYESSPPWRRFLEHLYRSVAGFGIYYAIERWWKDKFFPRGDAQCNSRHWWDFALLIIYLLLFNGMLVLLAGQVMHTSPIEAVFWGSIVPFAVWNTSMGWTVYIQHTHPRIPWSLEESSLPGQEQLTPYIRFPAWFGYLFHDINEHTAHHIAPKIPCYRLRKAQRLLAKKLHGNLVDEPFSIRGFFKTLKACKLYDYDRRRWCDFRGRPTTEPVDFTSRQQVALEEEEI